MTAQRILLINPDGTAEASDGQWFKLMAYALRPDDLTDERLDDIKRRLIAAWREVYA